MLQEPCACGMRYAGGGCGGRCSAGAAVGPAFSLLFPAAAGGHLLGYVGAEQGGGVPVDCTLSLGTPSTRRAEARGSSSRRQQQPDGGAAVASCKESAAGRGLAARRCANCDTASTPLWRNGPRGPKSLCNACGIRYKKEERRAAASVAPAAATTTQDTGGLGAYACGAYYARQKQQAPQPQWGGCYGSAAAKSASPFATSYYGDSAAADGPCLSWMLNVMPSTPAFAVRDRPTLFQYY